MRVAMQVVGFALGVMAAPFAAADAIAAPLYAPRVRVGLPGGRHFSLTWRQGSGSQSHYTLAGQLTGRPVRVIRPGARFTAKVEPFELDIEHTRSGVAVVMRGALFEPSRLLLRASHYRAGRWSVHAEEFRARELEPTSANGRASGAARAPVSHLDIHNLLRDTRLLDWFERYGAAPPVAWMLIEEHRYLLRRPRFEVGQHSFLHPDGHLLEFLLGEVRRRR